MISLQLAHLNGEELKRVWCSDIVWVQSPEIQELVVEKDDLSSLGRLLMMLLLRQWVRATL